MKVHWFPILLGTIMHCLIHPIAGRSETSLAQVYHDDKSGLTILSWQIELPGQGLWKVYPQESDTEARLSATLDVPDNVQQALYGERGRALQQARWQRTHRSNLRQIRHALLQEARGSASAEWIIPPVEELSKEKRDRINKALTSLPVPSHELLDPPKPPHAAIVPNARFVFDQSRDETHRHWFPTNAAPLVVELHPLEDDGKHYVLKANGRLERHPIDPHLMGQLGVDVVPLQRNPKAGHFPETAHYHLLARYKAQAPGTLLLTNQTTGATMQKHLPAHQDTLAGDRHIFTQWAGNQAAALQDTARKHNASGLQTWSWIRNYQANGSRQPSAPSAQAAIQATDLMGVLGGSAAMRETLQLQALQIGELEDEPQTIPISDIRGVEIESHPYESMLGDHPGGSYPLADVVPSNQFFIGISQPQAIASILEEGTAFLGRIGAGTLQQGLNHNLTKRYLSALGLDSEVIESLLQANIIAEIAMTAPDLFFYDGTDIAIIARLHQQQLIERLLPLLGLPDASSKEPVAFPTPHGNAWWAIHEDLVILGMRQDNVQRILTLAQDKAKPSLGRSHEFRYMLTKVPPTPDTRAYVYFSDDFIRQLVGPDAKIRQLRRMHEKARLQTVAYAALLRTYDGAQKPASVNSLVEAGYLPAVFSGYDITIDDDGVPISGAYGALPRMDSIWSVPVTHATETEARAYENYRNAYARFWTRFFDPIAIRIEQEQDELIATTFILPLVENSLYQGARSLINADPMVPLHIPQLLPQPSAMVSLNLTETAWRNMLSEQLIRWGDAAGMWHLQAFDQLGPAFHFATFDAEPVLAFGSRSLMGFGGRFGDFNMEMGIGLLISMFTRPCALVIELQDEQPVRRMLESGEYTRLFGSLFYGINVSGYQLAKQDKWVAVLDIEGFAIRFSVAIDNGHLIVSNMPWREPIQIAETTRSDVAGASLGLYPEAVQTETRALYLNAMEGERASTIQALAYLQPLLLAGTSPEQVFTRHKQLFGTTPILPYDQTLNWNGVTPGAGHFGTLTNPAQPSYDHDRIFGFLQGIRNIRASMQFEDTGLRTIVRWQFQPTQPE